MVRLIAVLAFCLVALGASPAAHAAKRVAFVVGIEHWCLYDPAVSNWVDSENFGLATLQDNAYDGVEARRARGTDPRGYPIGGEEADYGNLLGGLSTFLKGIGDRLPGK